jgi:predicted Zn-dependent protease
MTPASSPATAPRPSWGLLPWTLAISIIVLAVAGYFGAMRWMAVRSAPERNPALRRGVALWQAQKGDIAEAEFATAARQMPRSALPHIYLSRLARERGDLNAAFDEAARAARLEANNPLAMREVGSVLLARGDYEGARKFLVRAVRTNPQDKAAMGWLACSLQKLGDTEQASRWAARAGPGGWSACMR